jgi:colanic acid biosynthesis protein WcaH
MISCAVALALAVISNYAHSMERDKPEESRLESSTHFALGLAPEQVRVVSQRLPSELYGSAIDNLIISCVDIFVYDPIYQKYLVVLRNNRPAQGCWFIPGGRQNKGEGFFECARRKCAEELGLAITCIATVSTYGTIFPDSEYNTQTHSNNRVILAIAPGAAEAGVQVDGNHGGYRWIPLDHPPGIEFGANVIEPYFTVLYTEALEIIAEYQEEWDTIYGEPRSLTIERKNGEREVLLSRGRDSEEFSQEYSPVPSEESEGRYIPSTLQEVLDCRMRLRCLWRRSWPGALLTYMVSPES